MLKFLAVYKIYEGEHSHKEAIMFRAKDYDQATLYAEDQQHDVEDEEGGCFNFGDGTTAAELIRVETITDEQYTFLKRIGLATDMGKIGASYGGE